MALLGAQQFKNCRAVQLLAFEFDHSKLAADTVARSIPGNAVNDRSRSQFGELAVGFPRNRVQAIQDLAQQIRE